MTYESFGDLEALVQEKIDGDSDFQATLTDLSDEDKESAIKNRKSQLFDEEIKNIGLTSKKNEELANNYKTRAEKAEQEAKEAKKNKAGEKKNDNDDNYSIKDVVALSKVDLDDVDEVKRIAKILGKPIYEAINDPVTKSILSQRDEFRKSAEATNVSNARRSPARLSDEALIESANSGKMPESDEDIARLMKAKMGKK